MGDNLCQDRMQPVDPIDREANNINRFLQNGDRLSASARLRDDLANLGPTQFMALIGETKTLANITNSATHIEITPLQGKIDVALVTPVRDERGAQVLLRDPLVRIDNNEIYELPRTVPCEPAPPQQVPCEPPPPRQVPTEPSQSRYPAPWEQVPTFPRPIEHCPPGGTVDPGLRINLDFVFKDIFGHKGNENREQRYPQNRYEPNRYEPNRYDQNRYEPNRYEPRHDDNRGGRSDSNRGDGNVIVNNYNTVTVKGGDANSSSSSNSDSHNQKQDPHKKAEHHK